MPTTRMPDGTSDLWDDNPQDEVPKNTGPMVELGVTGLKRVSGYVDDEFLPALRGRKAIAVYKEMSLNDSMVGSLMFAIDKLIREVDWKVVPADHTDENSQAQEFLESVKDDMSHSWDDFIGEVLSMLPFGWSWHEIVFKKRVGPWEKNPAKRSKYTDGLFGIRKMPIRSQETLMRWVFDDNGGIKAMVQMAPPKYSTTVIPINKSLLFRTSISKGNPEGVSLLRTAYRSWYFKKRLEEFEAIGVERDLAGMPVAKVPAEFLRAAPGTDMAKTVEAYRKMVRGVRRDENEGLVLPSQWDPETKQPLYEFELMSSSGSRQFDTNAIIQRYEQRILMSVLADFILVGHEQTGSYSLHTDKTGIFRAALNAITKAICDTLNRHLVPKLFEVNGWKLDQLPKFEASNIDPPDLDQLAQFISSTAGAGMQWFPDPELEQFVREIAHLPEMTDEAVEYKRHMFAQTQAMEYATNQMGLISMKQKAEMTGQGLTPEQAEMQAQTPTPEMQEQDLLMQQKQAEMTNIPPPEDPNEAKRFKREKESAQLQDKMADKSHRRDKEKLAVQDKFADRTHRRGLEATKAKGKADEAKTRQEILRAKIAAKKATAPAKKTAAKKTAKKTPPKKGKK